MIRDGARTLALICAAILVGAIGWSGEALLLPLAFLFPALWTLAPSRAAAIMVSAGYFLAASRGLPQGVANFYGTDFGAGIALWFGAALAFVIVHGALWTAWSTWVRILRYGLAALLMSVPPFGIVGWAHPITAAGLVFPGWGWGGLSGAVIGLLAMTTKYWPIAILILGGLWIWSALTWTPPTLPQGWAGINTSFHFTEAGQYADYAQHMTMIDMVKKAAQQGAKTVVLPESAVGIWTPTTERLWTRELSGLSVIVNAGAIVVGQTGYDNVMVEMREAGAEIIYAERMPVPISMWQPWTQDGANAHFFSSPVVDFGGAPILPLICYEQLLIWPVLQSMILDPEVMVATGNGWWTGGTNIVPIQKASAQAWASLFGLPLVLAFNH